MSIHFADVLTVACGVALIASGKPAAVVVGVAALIVVAAVLIRRARREATRHRWAVSDRAGGR